jgi:hypothetical protein
MIPDTRRAGAAFALSDASGAVVQSGNAEAVIGDETLSVGPVTISFLDADRLVAADYRIEIELWPNGKLQLTQLGRRFDTFVAELRRIRNLARVGGLLAHGITMPEVFPGAVLSDGGPRTADFQLYDTHVTVVPADADPWQVPLGSVTRLRSQDDPPAVVLETPTDTIVLGQLARQRDAFERAISERREAQRQLLEGLTGQSSFSDGWGVSQNEIADFENFTSRFTAPERASCRDALLARATDGARLGFVQLLDPDQNTLQCAALPEHWGVFLLARIGSLTVLEMLAGPAAATYAFRAELAVVNTDLQLLHFRRAPLALTAEQAELTPSNPHRLALRRLEPLKRLRASTAARLIHTDGWEHALRSALELPAMERRS